MGKNTMTFWLYILFLTFFGCLIYLTQYFPLNSIRSQQMLLNVGRNKNSESSLDQNLVENEKLKQVVQLNPNNCEAQKFLALNSGLLAFGTDATINRIKDQQAYNDTVITFKEVIQRCPNTPTELRARYLLAYVYYHGDDFANAINEAQQLIAKYPSDSPNLQVSEAYHLLAWVYEKQGDNQRSLAALLQSGYSNPELNKTQEILTTSNDLINSDEKLKQMFNPNKSLGFGKFPTAAISNGVIHFIGNSPVASYFTSENKVNWNISRILLAKDNIMGALSIDHDEKLHLVYAIANSNTIFYMANPNNIESVPLLIDVSEWCKQCQIMSELGAGVTAIQIHEDNQSIPNLIWTFSVEGLAYSKISDGKLSEPELFAAYGKYADFVLDSMNNIHVVYAVSNGDIFPTAQARIWYREKINGEWKEPIQLSKKNIWAGGTTISMTQDGTMHVVYISGSSADDARLMYVYRNLDGMWSEPQVIADKKFRPWIPKNYGGKYTVAAAALADNVFALVWRVPKDENSTYLVGTKLDQSGWSTPVVITEILGQDYNDTPSIVQESQPYPDNLKLIWSNAGEIKYFEWRP